MRTQWIKPIERMFACWGVPYVKTYGLSVQASNWSEVRDGKKGKISKDMAVLAKRVKSARIRKPSPYICFLFCVMANTRKKNPDYMTAESAYWRENGWLDKVRPWK